MEFGVFILAQQRGYHQSSRAVIANSVQQTIAAEAAGFDAAWYAEHHFNNYSLVPSPLMMVAHCAGLTSTIRLGTAVCVLPLYHPNRLLAEVGFADTVSNGRLELGVGSGYQQFEFERFGVNVDEAPAVFNEYLEVLQKGLRERIFDFDGQFLRVPPTAISVRSVQSPTPPIWLAAGSTRSMGRAMREGHNLFVTALLGGLDDIRSLRHTIEQAGVQEKRDVADTKVGFLRCAFASDNDAEITSYIENARFQRRLSESLHQRRQQSSDGYLMAEQPSPNDLSLDTIRANIPVGSVNQVIDRLLEEISILKPNHIALQTQLGDFDQTTMLRQIELWGDRIIPAIKRELGTGAAPAGLQEPLRANAH